MKLRDLDARFVRYTKTGGHTDFDENEHLLDFAEAHGIMFQCPKCAAGCEIREELDPWYGKRRSAVGAHYVQCWFAGRGVPDSADPKPGRWHPSGTGIDDLTFMGPGAASVLLTSGCGWHGFVKNGDAS